MVNERTICCCGASSWTRVIAWIQIVGNSLLLLLVIIALAVIGSADPSQEIGNRSSLNAALAFAFIISFFGIIMGVILLKGTQERRVSFIKAWIIYGIAALAVSIIGIILNAAGNSSVTVGTSVVSGILGIGINLFSVIIVYIHMKEINEGVFIP